MKTTMNTDLKSRLKNVAAMVGLAVGLTVAASQAQAAVPLVLHVPGSDNIERVEGGCGPGGHRDRFGNCRPNFRPVYRACPPGFHPTPYGCRRNY